MIINKEQFTELAGMQKVLDNDILAAKELIMGDTILKRLVAAIVELGEYANEERFFKFWSNKTASEKDIRVDEYVDVLHFLLSMMNYYNVKIDDMTIWEANYDATITPYQLNLTQIWLGTVGAFLDLGFITDAKENFARAFNLYFLLGERCGLNWEDVYDGYKKKNVVNFERLASGY